MEFPITYDPETGELRWTEDINNGRIKAGSLAGCFNAEGYGRFAYQRKYYLVHRVAWFLMTGEWPKHHIDHIDGNPRNNKWSNLREATHSENLCNKPKHKNNTSGYKGVYYNKRTEVWYARIKKDKRQHYLGQFSTKEEASAAYEKAAEIYHREYKCAWR